MATLVEKRVLYPLSLGGLFLLAFTLPIFFLIQMYGDESALETSEEEHSVFSAVNVPGPNVYLRVNHAEVLDPQAGKDFLFWVWFRLKRFPEEGEPVIFVAKLDAEDRSRSGYTFGVTREGDNVLPIVYWRDREGRGASHTFSELKLLPKKWTFMAISFTEGRFLGAHSTVISEGSDRLNPQVDIPTLLGGYELDPPVVPSSPSPLILGALKNGKFRGKIGPFGILQGVDLSDRIPEILADVSALPPQSPSLDSEDSLGLLVSDGETDSSSHQHEVALRGKGNKHRSEKKKAAKNGQNR